MLLFAVEHHFYFKLVWYFFNIKNFLKIHSSNENESCPFTALYRILKIDMSSFNSQQQKQQKRQQHFPIHSIPGRSRAALPDDALKGERPRADVPLPQPRLQGTLLHAAKLHRPSPGKDENTRVKSGDFF